MLATVPKEFPYLASALISTALLLQWQSSAAGRARRKAGIKYPQLYAEKAEAEASRDAHLFNCAQRAHQQTLETVPGFLITVLVTSVKYPMFAAGGCAAFVVGRIFFTLGYQSGDPLKRYTRGGVIGAAAQIAMLASSLWTVVSTVQGS